ncbi:MAG: hypothetical protein J7493_04940 [Porphyrobacter sp.]|nr:hypothetical protein [Porphyrobacter sp.]
MAKKVASKPSKKSRKPVEQPPTLVQCLLQIPKDKADALIPHLGIALDCGSASVRRKRDMIEVETVLDVEAIGDIVEKGVSVLVTKRISIAPVPSELFSDLDEWIREVEGSK